MGAVAAAPTRLPKAERRERLLDAAAEMLVEQGTLSLTMEGLAERAGVSKALPYAHFENADAVVAALYQREIAHIGERLMAAVAAAAPGEPKVRAAIHAYFDIVADRGRALELLTSAGTSSTSRDPRLGHRFVAGILEASLGIGGKRGLALATIVFAATHGALESWSHRDISRDALEAVVVRMILSGAEDLRLRN